MINFYCRFITDLAANATKQEPAVNDQLFFYIYPNAISDYSCRGLYPHPCCLKFFVLIVLCPGHHHKMNYHDWKKFFLAGPAGGHGRTYCLAVPGDHDQTCLAVDLADCPDLLPLCCPWFPCITAACSCLASLPALLTLATGIAAFVAFLSVAIIRFLIWHNKRFKNY